MQSELRDALSASFWVACRSLPADRRACAPSRWCRRRSRCWSPCRSSIRGCCWRLTIPCIAISSSICYWFAEAIAHGRDRSSGSIRSQIRKLKDLLQRYQLPIIIGWSFFLLLPTDVLCYVCGSLKINYKKFLIGVIIGEGTVYAIYIFFGDWLLRLERTARRA